MKNTIIEVAPVAFLKHVNNPITPEEIAEEVYKCYKEGATVCHLHMRDEQGRETSDITGFLKTLRLIKEKCEILVNVKKESYKAIEPYLNEFPEVKIAPVHVGSVTLFDFAIGCKWSEIVNDVEELSELKLIQEMCIFDLANIHNTKKLIKLGKVNTPYYYTFYLNYPGELPVSKKNIKILLDEMDTDDIWFYAECDRRNFENIELALKLGGNIRVGFEDSFHDDEFATNHMMVKKVAKLSKECGRGIADINETKRILGVK